MIAWFLVRYTHGSSQAQPDFFRILAEKALEDEREISRENPKV